MFLRQLYDRLIAGVAADAVGYGGAIAVVAALTATSGLWAAFDMPADGHTEARWRQSSTTTAS